MFLQSTFVTEFLAETNLILTQEDFGSKLGDLLSPVKNYLQKEKNILSFSLARYSGADTHLAYFCEWYYHTNKLIRNSHPLFLENHEFYVHNIPAHLSAIPSIQNTLDQQIMRWHLPFQLSIFQYKTKEQITDLVAKNGYLNRYLSSKYLSQVTASEVETTKSLMFSRIPLSQYIEAQGFRLSFLQVGLPCLVAFLYNFNQPDSPINSKGVKWFMVEDILGKIAILHQSATSPELRLYLHRLSLNEREEFEWFALPRALQIEQAELDESVTTQLHSIRERIKIEAFEKLEKLIFPDKFKDMLKDLVDWGYNFGQEND